ncbi:mevalonate kinase [Aspergillus nomiae NRRL 13137]|uniref:Mevalonate kinase n=1 Tax=Aspergillus nomiae NRRL (strain ATCC 15546 / NRRL 13137 / CBS 260.88 / M93) TaxID=1509407 RepID=A0A0L1JDV4_ASPN3|nr:mevalonate kinase [Aspergillus nomiae NRRL 13137]KNG89921.1 mevalonate kinase [Aspergillus nomiae NRRL 13137]
MVSAPGKAIVFGEHAAVYAQPAIAAAISLRSCLLIGLNHTWETDALPWNVFHHPCKKRFYYSDVNYLDAQFLKAILPHAEAVSKHLPEQERKIHIKSATAFLYLYLCLSLGPVESPGFIYTLRSTIPIGTCLGSSVSVCVRLSTALLLQIRALAGPQPGQPLEEAEIGVDTTVSASGKVVMFQRNASGQSSVIRLTKFPRLPLLLVDTQQPRSTAIQVDKPEITDLILDGIGKIATSALALISSAELHGSGAADALGHLGALIGMTKLTGAGGGGCAIIFLRPDIEDQTIEELERTFTAEGFRKYEIILVGDGVGVLWPAVFTNGIDGKPGEEINQVMFEKAEGVEGINQLIGEGVQDNREGWGFYLLRIESTKAEIEEVKHDQNVHRDQNEKLHDEVRALQAQIEAIPPAALARSWAAVAANGNTFQKLSDEYPDTFTFIGSQLAPYTLQAPMPTTVLKEHQKLYLGPKRALGVILNSFKVINIDIDDSSIAVSSPNEMIAPMAYQGDGMRDARYHVGHHAGHSQGQHQPLPLDHDVQYKFPPYDIDWIIQSFDLAEPVNLRYLGSRHNTIIPGTL